MKLNAIVGSTLREYNDDWQNPDSIYSKPGTTTFIYNGKLFAAGVTDPRFAKYYAITGHKAVTHASMVAHPEISQAVLGDSDRQEVIEAAASPPPPPPPPPYGAGRVTRRGATITMPRTGLGTLPAQQNTVAATDRSETTQAIDSRKTGEEVMYARRENATDVALMGRTNGDVVSFWPCGEPLIEALLPGCLKALIGAGVINGDSKLHVSEWDGTPTVASYLSGDHEVKRAGPWRADQVELAKRMHLARGDEKKAIMKQLGVGSSRTTNHPVTRSLRNAGKLSPGHDFWRMTSEGELKLRMLSGEGVNAAHGVKGPVA